MHFSLLSYYYIVTKNANTESMSITVTMNPPNLKSLQYRYLKNESFKRL